MPNGSDRNQPRRQKIDDSFERLLKTMMREPAAPTSEACLDAEQLAAWSEGTLSASKTRDVELHLSTCARCQAMLAVFSRSEPVVSPGLPFWRRWTFAWVVPLAAGAAVLVVWTAWPRTGTEQRAALTMERLAAPAVSVGQAEATASGLAVAGHPAAGRGAAAGSTTKKEVAGNGSSKPATSAASPVTNLPQSGKLGVPTSAAAGEARRGVANNAMVDAISPIETKPPAPAPAAAPSLPPAATPPPAAARPAQAIATPPPAGARPAPAAAPTGASDAAMQRSSGMQGQQPAGGTGTGQGSASASVRAEVSAVSSVLTGTVTDPGGAVIPGATVHMTKNGARVADVVTDGNGRYRVAGVAPGTYDLNFTMRGFRTESRPNVDAPSGRETQLNATLQVGAAVESVLVMAEGARSGAPTVVAEIVADAALTKSASPVSSGEPGGGRGGAGGGVGRASGLAPLSGQPASPPTRWRILTSGAIERSTTAGASWEAVTIDPAARFTSGAAPSPSICWLIGRNGVVFLATDGLHFNLIPFPETTDLSSIRATDARRATVTTAGGLVFATSDGGATWQRQD